MNTPIPISTGADPSRSLGIVSVTKFHRYPEKGDGLNFITSLDFTEEVEALQAQGTERGATAITDIAFQTAFQPGGIIVVATGTAKA